MLSVGQAGCTMLGGAPSKDANPAFETLEGLRLWYYACSQGSRSKLDVELASLFGARFESMPVLVLLVLEDE